MSYGSGDKHDFVAARLLSINDFWFHSPDRHAFVLGSQLLKLCYFSGHSKKSRLCPCPSSRELVSSFLTASVK